MTEVVNSCVGVLTVKLELLNEMTIWSNQCYFTVVYTNVVCHSEGVALCYTTHQKLNEKIFSSYHGSI